MKVMSSSSDDDAEADRVSVSVVKSDAPERTVRWQKMPPPISLPIQGEALEIILRLMAVADEFSRPAEPVVSKEDVDKLEIGVENCQREVEAAVAALVDVSAESPRSNVLRVKMDSLRAELASAQIAVNDAMAKKLDLESTVKEMRANGEKALSDAASELSLASSTRDSNDMDFLRTKLYKELESGDIGFNDYKDALSELKVRK